MDEYYLPPYAQFGMGETIKQLRANEDELKIEQLRLEAKRKHLEARKKEIKSIGLTNSEARRQTVDEQ
jgi:hypothetical protein